MITLLKQLQKGYVSLVKEYLLYSVCNDNEKVQSTAA